VHWLYNSGLPAAAIDFSVEKNVGTILLNLAKHHVFGLKINDTAFQNVIMDHFIAIHVRTRKLTFSPMIDVVYQGTREDSQMRKLLANMYAFILAGDTKKLVTLKGKPEAFVIDIMQSMLEIRPTKLEDWWFYLEQHMYHKAPTGLQNP
jgi:hypothetical protein